MNTTSMLLYALIALVTAAVYFIRKRLNYWKDRGVAYEEPSLLMGNCEGFTKTRSLTDIFDHLYKKFKGTGPFCGMFFFQKPAALLLDMDLIRNVLIKDFSNFVDRGFFINESSGPLTGHLGNMTGNKWRKMRAKLSPTFTSGKMKFMFHTLVEVAERFNEIFGEIVDAKADKVLEVRDILGRFTVDVIGNVAFGIECNSLSDPKAEFLSKGRRSFNERRYHPLIMAVIDSFPKMTAKLGAGYFPKDITDFFVNVVRQTVDYREKNNIQKNDFLNTLIELKNSKDESTQGLTLEEMTAQAFVFFLGGFETSSTTMGFALYELAQNQVIQQRLRDEIVDTLEANKNQLTYECLKSMTYMTQVISETLRKNSLVQDLHREAINEYPVPGNPKYVLPKSIHVIIPAGAIQRDPEYYPNPEVFDPDRFTPEMVKQRPSVHFLPFGDGPRNCIGMRFGQMQAHVGLTYLLKNFRFSTCPQTEIPYTIDKCNIALAPANGIYLRVERI